jgi:hypothetical protein
MPLIWHRTLTKASDSHHVLSLLKSKAQVGFFFFNALQVLEVVFEGLMSTNTLLEVLSHTFNALVLCHDEEIGVATCLME